MVGEAQGEDREPDELEVGWPLILPAVVGGPVVPDIVGFPVVPDVAEPVSVFEPVVAAPVVAVVAEAAADVPVDPVAPVVPAPALVVAVEGELHPLPGQMQLPTQGPIVPLDAVAPVEAVLPPPVAVGPVCVGDGKGGGTLFVRTWLSNVL
jgi:hypothetical protein